MHRKYFESFFGFFCWSKDDLILILLRLAILGLFYSSLFWIVANVLNQLFLFCFMAQDGWWYMSRLLMVFFLGIFWKSMLCKLQNQRWSSNVISNSRCVSSKMTKFTLRLWHPLAQCCKKGTLPIKNGTSHCQLNPWQITFGNFLARCAIIVRLHFF